LSGFLITPKTTNLKTGARSLAPLANAEWLLKNINHEHSELFLGSETTLKSDRALAKINASFAEQIRQSAAIFIFGRFHGI